MEFLLWHGLAICSVIAISFTLGFITGKQNVHNSKRIHRSK